MFRVDVICSKCAWYHKMNPAKQSMAVPSGTVLSSGPRSHFSCWRFVGNFRRIGLAIDSAVDYLSTVPNSFGYDPHGTYLDVLLCTPQPR